MTTKSLSLLFLRPKPMAFSTLTTTTEPTLSLLFLFPKPKPTLNKPLFSLSQSLSFSTTSTPYPLQYDLIINRPTQPPPAPTRRRLGKPNSDNSTEPDARQETDPESGFDTWVDQKLENMEMDKSKRKYYKKRRKRMYGSDSDEDGSRKSEEGFVELKPDVVEFHRLHKREEELYFYDTFAYPWEKDKHYKMVYQLEKKYFPDQCLDKAFLDHKDSNLNQNVKGKKSGKREGDKRGNNGVGEGEEDKKLVFFEEEKKERLTNSAKDVNKDVTERKVEEFFKCLKKVPNKDNEVGSGEPYPVSRRTELPPRWDGACGTVVLVNKPKG